MDPVFWLAPIFTFKKMDKQFLLQNLDVVEDTLVQGIRDYMSKYGFSRCHLGLSGGIDSALVAHLAVRTVGKENVVCFRLPSRFSSQGSLDDAATVAKTLGCRCETLPLEPIYVQFLETLKDVFEGRPFDSAEENLQARIRGTLLMAFSNKFQSILLATGNKSEAAMGYCTLYGDTMGALAPIGDLFKTEVFALCRRINEKSRAQSGHDIIPEAILTKAPSAELRPGQTDQDKLPPYDVLDAVLEQYLHEHQSAEQIAETLKMDKGLTTYIIQCVDTMEFKRRQSPAALKVRS
jgi:NAD+ synthase (glutamine-hydrolysing)